MFFDQIVHKYIRPNVSPHQTRRTNVALAGRAQKHPAGFGEKRLSEVGGDHSSPATDFTMLMFHKTDLKTRIHFSLFWDHLLCDSCLEGVFSQYPVENWVFPNLIVVHNLCAHLNLLITGGLDQRRTSR